MVNEGTTSDNILIILTGKDNKYWFTHVIRWVALPTYATGKFMK